MGDDEARTTLREKYFKESLSPDAKYLSTPINIYFSLSLAYY